MLNCPICDNHSLEYRHDIYKDGRCFLYCDICGALQDEKTAKLQEQLRATITEKDARIEALECTLDEWSKRTEWVQENAKPKDLGKHRADAMNDRIAQLEEALAMAKSALEYYDFANGVPQKALNKINEVIGS